ncbi:hypothetical protein VPH35_052058 [Triticum aestivum]|uniref:3'-5' exonuclease domain-containing protein n=1 Tax=Triticum aestivum TaxID=4565 RepID=A0A077RSK1_WHEAT|nr:unnamed protein product [Triticum aestivum]
MADAPLYKQRRRYTRELHDVDLHGNHKLHVVCTSKDEDVDKMLSTLRRKLGRMPVKLVGIDVEYMHYVMPQRAAVLQLCVEKECLVYHISTAKNRSTLDNYIDIQVEWRDPYNKKKFDSLADVAGRMIDIHYHDMKKKINRKEDHTLWGFCPLPEKLIKYAAIDAFATYESWRIIYDVIMGLGRAKRDKEAKKKKNKDAHSKLQLRLRLVPGSASQGGGEGDHDPPPHPLLGLVLTHEAQCKHFVFPTIGCTQPQSKTPKIDREAMGCDGLAYACGVAACRVAACSSSFQARPPREVGRGVTIPPPHPLLGLMLTHTVHLVDKRRADILFFQQ